MPTTPHEHGIGRRSPSPPTLRPYRIRALGRVGSPSHSTPGTWFDDAMLTVFMAGRGVYLWRGRRIEVQGGMVGVVPPDGDTGLLMADPDDPYDHYYCRFGGREAVAAARRIVQRHEGRRFFNWPDSDTLPPLLQRMWTLRRLGPSVGPDDPLTPAEGLLAHVLATLEAPPPTNQLMTLSAGRLVEYLQEHLAEPISLEPMARHFAISKAHLCRRARALLGDTLVSTAESMKVRWAQTLLKDSELSIKQVAQRVGYADPLYFSKVFRRRTGLSPARWRRQRPSR